MIKNYSEWRKLNESDSDVEFSKSEIEEAVNKWGHRTEDIEWSQAPNGETVELTFDNDLNISDIADIKWTFTWRNIDDLGIGDILGFDGLTFIDCKVTYRIREVESEYDDNSIDNVEVTAYWKGDAPKNLDDLRDMLNSDYQIWATLDATGKINWHPLKEWDIDVEFDNHPKSGEISDDTMRAFIKLRDDYDDSPGLIDEIQKAWGISQEDIDEYLSRN